MNSVPFSDPFAPPREAHPQDQQPASDVHGAICAVRRAVPYIQKQKGAGVNYTFVGIENVLNELRPALELYSLAVVPVQTRVIASDQYKTSKGSVMQRVILRVAYRITHTPSNTSIDCEVAGEAADSGDKATPKAMTAAQKAMLRQVFLLESGDLDPDTYLSQELGADYERVKTAQKSLASARNQDELEKCWGVVQTRPFSGRQMQSLRVAYDQTRARLAGRSQAATAGPAPASPAAPNQPAPHQSGGISQSVRNGAAPRRPIGSQP